MSTYQLPEHNLKSVNAEIAQQPEINHAPRILVLYGSLREGSYSKKLALESAEILRSFGAKVKVFDPSGLPVYQSTTVDHLKVQQLREMANWSEGMLWSSPELHGNMSGVFKNQIDWIPLSDGSVRPTQGKTLALMQVNGGSQSFNVVNN
ncbi:MAG: NAD(P)H-dependent oxidoreductase, partial [Pseudomonadales bacterium]|nr:NAD(P)H-dependent oxidoreductase [Pseudomonadales bacterium]